MTNQDSGGFGPQFEPEQVESFTETTHTSWLQRLGNSLMGILIGLLLLAGSAWGIFWNEGRSVATIRSLGEGRGLVVSVQAGRIDPANDGKLVHVSGDAAAAAPLVDAQFHVSAKGLKLERTVEMYQWREEEKTETRTKLGGGEEKVTTYSYSRVWKTGHTDSSRFRQPGGHENPPPVRGANVFAAKDARLGAFALPAAMLERLGQGAELALTPAHFSGPTGLTPPVRLMGSRVYVGSDPGRPQVGDLRVSYSLVENGPVSAIGRQTGQALAPFQTRAGDQLYMINTGIIGPEQMFAAAEQENRILTWIIRGVALLAMWVGFSLIFAPLSVLVSVIPFLEDVVGAGAGLLALLLTLLMGSLLIAIAWLTVRPLLSLGLILGGLALAFGVSRLAAARRVARENAAASPRTT